MPALLRRVHLPFPVVKGLLPDRPKKVLVRMRAELPVVEVVVPPRVRWEAVEAAGPLPAAELGLVVLRLALPLEPFASAVAVASWAAAFASSGVASS